LKRSLKPKKGFSFLEVLAALVILSAALIPIMLWVPTAFQSKLQTERKTTAIFLAQSKIEELHYRIIKNFSFNYNVTSSAFSSPYENYYYTVTDDLNSSLKTISVTVWHTEKPDDPTTFYTQIAKR